VSQGEGRKAGASGCLQVGSSVSQARAGGGNDDVQETSTQELAVSAKKTREFCKNPPGLWGFSRKFESELFLQCLVIQTYFEKVIKLTRASLLISRRSTCFILTL
jgi:hypothetical protein